MPQKQLEQAIAKITNPVMVGDASKKKLLPYHLERVTANMKLANTPGYWLVTQDGHYIHFLGKTLTIAYQTVMDLPDAQTNLKVSDLLEAEQILLKIGQTQTEYLALEAKQKSEQQKITAKYHHRLLELQEKIKFDCDSLYFHTYKREPGCKSIKLHAGVIGWRAAKQKVEILGDEDAAIEELQKSGFKDLLRTKLSINKNAILDIFKAGSRQMKKLATLKHIRVKSLKDEGEKFFVKPKDGKEIGR